MAVPLSRDLHAARQAFAANQNVDASRRAHDVGSSANPFGDDLGKTENHLALMASSVPFQHAVQGAYHGLWSAVLSLVACHAAAIPLRDTVALITALVVGGACHAGMVRYTSLHDAWEFAMAEKKREQWELDQYEEGEVRSNLPVVDSASVSALNPGALVLLMAGARND